MSGQATAREFRYEPQRCSFFCKHVWAIRTRQGDGSWKIVNCLDKDESCFGVDCAFTTSCGEWPYPAPFQPAGERPAES